MWSKPTPSFCHVGSLLLKIWAFFLAPFSFVCTQIFLLANLVSRRSWVLYNILVYYQLNICYQFKIKYLILTLSPMGEGLRAPPPPNEWLLLRDACMYWFETSWLFLNIKNKEFSHHFRCLLAPYLLPPSSLASWKRRYSKYELFLMNS